jgi:hypothetical protein
LPRGVPVAELAYIGLVLAGDEVSREAYSTKITT